MDKDFFQFTKLIVEKRLAEALEILQAHINTIQNQYFTVQFEKYKENYLNILNYSIQYGKDPQREAVLSKLYRSVIELGEMVKCTTHCKESRIIALEFTSPDIAMNDYALEFQKMEYLILDGNLENEWLKEMDISSTANKDDLNMPDFEKVFKYIVFSAHLDNKNLDILIHAINHSQQSLEIRAMLVSAIGLSTMQCFQIEKLLTLLVIMEKLEHQLWERAFIGVIFVLHKYHQRISMYAEFDDIINRLKTIPDIEKHLKDLLIQIVKANETEKISKQWEEDIMPQMMNMQSKIEDKLDLNNMMSDSFKDENPDWQEFFEDSPELLDKLQEYSQMQLEGSDIFMNTFSKMKNYPFFSRIHHWFIPFTAENKDVAKVIADHSAEINILGFIKTLELSSFICNSDKFSFCFNLRQLPAEHKEMLINLYKNEMKSFNELEKSDALIMPELKSKFVFSQYIQDLYRFYKLHPQRREFDDIFETPLNLHNFDFYTSLSDNNKLFREIAEYFFKQKEYLQAIQLFQIILKSQNNDSELLEKIGFAYQKQNNFESAISYYLQAELLEPRRDWLMKKIAYCYRRLNKYDLALKYYLELEKTDSGNLQVIANIGHTYLQLKDYENALQYYFKVDFNSESTQQILRPISFCAFVLKKYEIAGSYLDKLLEKEKNRYDLMNKAHVEWCLGNTKNAIYYYKQCLQTNSNDFQSFLQAIETDKQHLFNNGIDDYDFMLMMDYLRFHLEE